MSSTFAQVKSPLHRLAANAGLFQVKLAAVVLANLLLWASAKVQVPFWPVPMTMQTYVVLTASALLGWRLGALTVAAYLAEGALGLPVFAGSPANGLGLAYLAGPTGGYLVGYLVAAVLVGLILEKPRRHSLLGTTAALVLGEAAILGLGGCWLAAHFGWAKALAFGFGPFLAGDGLKVVLAIGTSIYARRLWDDPASPVNSRSSSCMPGSWNI